MPTATDQSELALPEDLQTCPGQLYGSGDESFEAKISFKRWSQSERRSRAFIKTGKISGTALLFCLGAILIPLVHFAVIPALALLTVITPILFIKYMGDEATFYFVDSQCPNCKSAKQLRPFVGDRLLPKITVQCKDCGETYSVKVLEET